MTGKKRGPKGPTGPRKHSLVSKLLSIAPGETIYLHEGNPSSKVWLSERNVHTIMARSPHLSGIRFSTERIHAIAKDPIRVIGLLAVRRRDND